MVALLDDEAARAELRALPDRAAADASPCWQQVAQLGATIEQRLLSLLFDTDLGPVTQRYAIF